MVFSRMAETRVLKQLTDDDRTTSDGKLFHNVTEAEPVCIYSHSWDEELGAITMGFTSIPCKFGCSGNATKP